MPRIVDCLAATVVAGMLCDDTSILADDDAIGVGMDLDWTTDCAGAHRVFVVVEPHQTRLRHRGLLRMEPGVRPEQAPDSMRSAPLMPTPEASGPTGFLSPYSHCLAKAPA